MASATATVAPSNFDGASAFKRRSASIFSRRGTETPIPQLRPLRMQSISLSPSKSKRWRLKRKPSEIQKGATILRAVPQETLSPNFIPFNPADRSFAPSPNTEILNSIGKGAKVPETPAPASAAPPAPARDSTQAPAPAPTPPSLSPPPPIRLPSADTSFLLPPTPTSIPSPVPPPKSATKSPKERRKSEEELKARKSVILPNAKVIGVWKDGRAHWDTEPPIPLVAHPSDAFLGLGNQSMNQLLPPPPPPPSPPKNQQRPRIQVVIPNDQRGRPFASVPFFTHQATVQPVGPGTKSMGEAPPTIPTAAANEDFRASIPEIVSGRSVSPPSVTNTTRPRFSVVSPLTSHSQPQPVRPFNNNQPLSSIAQEPESAKEDGSDHERENAGRTQEDSDHNQDDPDRKFRPSLSNSSASSNNGDAEDDASNYSKRSSMTSLAGDDLDSPPAEMPMKLRSRAGSVTFSIASPVAAGVFDEERRTNIDAVAVIDTPKPKRQQSRGKPRVPTGPLRVKSGIRRQHSASERARQSLTLQHVHDALSRMELPRRPSPTLSEAAHDLQMQLSAIDPTVEEVVFKWDDTEPVPSIPSKSPKRATAYSPLAERPPVLATLAPGPLPPRTPTPLSASSSNFEAKLKGLKLTIPVNNRPKPVESKAPTPVIEPEHVVAARAAAVERNITAQAAEVVILRIMENLDSLDDLFASAIVNKGFYRVFKRHELHLMRTVLRNMSAPAWEHREMSPPYPEGAQPDSAAPKPEYTPTSYLQFYMRDTYIIGALKSLILERCQSFLRRETAEALKSHDAMRSSRVDDAFWRIWTFSKLFGNGKGREDDVVGQMDWLRGGSLFHQKGCRATIMTTESFDVSTVLASAPECFGKGNPGGLSAEQLYDMTELWNCLSVLLQGLQGRTGHARAYGVYEPTNVRGGDVEGEEAMLEEWHYYLLTLGPSTILELAAPVQLPPNDPSLFVKAAEKGWTNWPPPTHGGSRKTFLKEAVSRVYEEKISASFSHSPEQMETKEMTRQRMMTHIHEIRRRKVSGDYRKITMSMERPMSEWENALNALTSPAPPVPPVFIPQTINVRGPGAPPPPRKPSLVVPSESHRRVGSGSSQGSSGRASTTSRAELPGTIPGSFAPIAPGSIPPQRQGTRSASAPVFAAPDLSQHPAFRSRASDQHPTQRDIIHSDLAENTADKAIFRIVEMGFTADQARHALRVTDLGDGLRIDRAVELLLRNA